MAYRYGQDRKQMMLFPQSIEEYIPEDHPVRAYDAFVDALDFAELGIELDPRKVGNSEYHPRLMLKLLLYGYSYGVRSSRKLERETYNNIAFIWLLRDLKPDHKTIAEFRRKNKRALKKTLKLSAELCLKLKLIEGNVLFVDGTKIQANAGKRQQHDQGWYEDKLEQVERRIDELLEECEQADQDEAGQGSWAEMPKELKGQQHLKKTIGDALDELKKRGKYTKNGQERTINRIDPESTVMHSVQGAYPSYNMQSVVDDKNGLIVSIDAVSDANDQNQFAPQIKAAEETVGEKCDVACADVGYYSVEQLSEVESEQTKVIVPSQKQVSKKPREPFDKAAFSYDPQADCYICPEGNRLVFRRFQNKTRTKRTYQIEHPALCRECRHFGSCTQSKRGRSVERHISEEVKEEIEKRYKLPEYRSIYERRKTRAEHPFGYIKKAIGFRQFGLRGRLGAQAEASLVAACFNVTRMISLLGGVECFIDNVHAV